MATQARKPIEIDLAGIDIEEVTLFVQEGARGIPEMAASSNVNPHPFCISCGAACSVA